MTTQEIRKKIAESPSAEWFSNVELTLGFNQYSYHQNLKGFSSIHKYVSQQIKGWEKIESLPQQFKESQGHFINIKKWLEDFLNSHFGQNNQSLDSLWRNQGNNYRNHNNLIPFDFPETEFLIDIFKTSSSYFHGAFKFITQNFQITDRDSFIGAIMAYEFKFKDVTEITNRRKKERASINQLRDSFNQLMQESEEQLSQHLKNANDDYTSYANQIDSFKNDKEKLFNEWFKNSSEDFKNFDESSQNRIAELEKKYEELLRLQKPADYWNKRARRLKKEGWWSIGTIVILVLIATLSIYILLWHSPDGMLSDVFKDTAKAIKWSILYISFLTFFAFGIRALTKVAFSSFHLARDAEEREQLTYLYLSLLNESSVDEKDRSLILQSLFSRSDTGLLKEDSSPTMPSNFIEKLLATIKK